jgi:hypothetical protein
MHSSNKDSLVMKTGKNKKKQSEMNLRKLKKDSSFRKQSLFNMMPSVKDTETSSKVRKLKLFNSSNKTKMKA